MENEKGEVVDLYVDREVFHLHSRQSLRYEVPSACEIACRLLIHSIAMFPENVQPRTASSKRRTMPVSNSRSVKSTITAVTLAKTKHMRFVGLFGQWERGTIPSIVWHSVMGS